MSKLWKYEKNIFGCFTFIEYNTPLRRKVNSKLKCTLFEGMSKSSTRMNNNPKKFVDSMSRYNENSLTVKRKFYGNYLGLLRVVLTIEQLMTEGWIQQTPVKQ